MGKFIDLTGMKFGKLTVVERAENRMDSSGVYRPYWKCVCDCGNIVEVKAGSLKSGNTRSCGCYCKERIRESHKKFNDYEIQEDYVIMYTSKGEPFFVDLEDFWKVKDICWYTDKDGYLIAQCGKKHFKIHRLIMNCPDGMEVDHIHGSESRNDNRKENLRIGTKSQNKMNVGRTSRNTSGVVGVCWSKSRNKWDANITVDNKCIRLGYFTNFEDAVKARKEAEEKYFGEWSYVNSQKHIYDGVDAKIYIAEDDKWYNESELDVYINQLIQERDAYKKELADWLRKACECIAGDDFDCSICPYYDVVTNNGCPSKVSVYAAKLRLEELRKEK